MPTSAISCQPLVRHRIDGLEIAMVVSVPTPIVRHRIDGLEKQHHAHGRCD